MTAETQDAEASVEFSLNDLSRQIEAAHADGFQAQGRNLDVLIAIGAAQEWIGDPFRLREALDELLTSDGPPDRPLSIAFSGRPGRPLTVMVTGAGAVTEHCAALIARTGGTVEDIPGRGVRITLQYRSVDATAAASPPAEPAGHAANLSGLRFLIADDSQTNLMVIREMLANTGAAMTTVSNGREAIDAWQDSDFDLLLLDIAMPVLDGMSALKHIRAAEDERKTGHVPAIAVTANVMPHQVAQYIIAGFDTHLSKPFRRSELIGAIMAVNAPV